MYSYTLDQDFVLNFGEIMPAHNPLRCSHAVMVQRGVGSNEVVLLDTGSYGGVSNFLNQTWTWNGTDWTQVNPPGPVDSLGPLPLRANYAMSYDGYNVLMFGGQGESETSGVQDDSWVWNGSTWTKLSPATVPFGRFKSELALLNSGSPKAVMFGGSNVLNYLNETWVWDGHLQTWTLASPTNSPPVRIDHMFANGPSFVVLFGGKGTNSTMNDTWKFDGTNWTQLTPTTPPSVRAEASFAYDIAHSQWVLFGGRNDNGMLPPQTWTLNSAGTAWTQASPATSPSARVGAQMCYDANTGSILLFGGNDQAGTVFNDTWSWNGTTWTQL